MKILDIKVLFKQGCFSRIRLWLSGWVRLPGAKFIMGLTGKETVITKDVVKPHVIFDVGEICSKCDGYMGVCGFYRGPELIIYYLKCEVCSHSSEKRVKR